MAKDAKNAALVLAGLSVEIKNTALENIASTIEANMDSLLQANQKDLEYAKNENIPGPLIARLALDKPKILGMVKGIRSVSKLPDPVGKSMGAIKMDEGLVLRRVACPIGVIGAIFESRPDAVPQISSLCLKSGNAVILKGGTEAQNSNKLLVELIRKGIMKSGEIPVCVVQLIESRAEVAEMLKQDQYINLVVPRGSNSFVRYVQENTKIPVLGHSEGICHVYIDDKAEIKKAIDITLDSKLQYPAACNAVESLLIHEKIASEVLPTLANQLKEKGVDLVGDMRACSLFPELKRAKEEDWDTEYNDLKLSIKIVETLGEAINHINLHGSGHTDTIVTEDRNNAENFMNEIDSASVMWNASTRFADGFRFGLGAEIGISTNKTHARGPVGLEGLVIYKFKLYGNGQVVKDYSGQNAKEFLHEKIEEDGLVD